MGSHVLTSMKLDLKDGSLRTLFDFLIEAHLFFKITSQSYRQEGKKKTIEMDLKFILFKIVHSNKI